MMRILLLAGTGEANQIAQDLHAAGHEVIASLAGATRSPRKLPCEMRIGGFGGDAGFADWLAAHRPDAVIDATHPFAARVTARSARLCKAADIPYLQMLRPEWPVHAEKGQVQVADIDMARKLIAPGARLFLATGRQTLQSFSGFSDCYLICRQIDPPDGPFPFKNGEYLIGKPPFSVDEERALFERLSLDWLIVKNAGGQASYSKIEAAAQLGLRVIFLARPPMPDADRVATIDEVLAWVARHADH